MSTRAERETGIVKAVLGYLRFVRRWPAWRNNTGAVRVGRRLIRFGEVGAADILGVLPGGRLLAVECKRPGNRATAAQAAWLAMIAEGGALALVVVSVEDLAAQLREAGY
jgi:hypothetical protein